MGPPDFEDPVSLISESALDARLLCLLFEAMGPLTRFGSRT